MSTPIRSAFVLGAGLGTRLRPLTDRCPKPLVPVCNRPLITYAFDQLIAAGVERIVINTHHCAERYAEVFPDGTYRGAELIFVHEPVLLETGGGIKNVEDLLGEAPFIVYNGDVLSDFAIEALVKHHFAAGNEVTLALRSSGGPLRVAYNGKSGLVTDITNLLETGNSGNCLLTGVYVVNPSLFGFIEPGAVVTVKLPWIEMIRTGMRVGGWMADEGRWHDLGSRESYLAVQRELSGGEACLESSVAVDPSAELEGMVVAGEGVVIGEGARVSDCVLWLGAKVAAGAELQSCVVTDGAEASGVANNRDF